MRTRLLLLFLDALSFWVTAGEHDTSITEERKLELPSVLIECSLTDIAVIFVPVIGNAQYYLTRPNGEVFNLDKSPYRPQHERRDVIATTKPPRNDRTDFRNQSSDWFLTFELFNVNGIEAISSKKDVFKEHLIRMKPNDFMIGPLSEGDHGNWVLSMYYTDSEGDVELFQVVSVVIVETVEARETNVELSEGSDFKPRFGYRIRNLESCEISSPGSRDRFYDREGTLDHCGYVVPNVTREDQGAWTIIGVGSVVYKATINLIVHNKSL